MDILLMLEIGLVVFLVYKLVKIAMARRLSARLAGALSLAPLRKQPALLWETGEILGCTPHPFDLITDLEQIFLKCSLPGMVVRYLRMARLVKEVARE